MTERINRYSFCAEFADCDAEGCLRPGRLTDFILAATDKFTKSIGMTPEAMLREGNAVWMTARLKYTLTRPIRTGDILTIEVGDWWIDIVSVYRLLSFFIGDERIGECVSVWMNTDRDTRSILRPASILPQLSSQPQVKHNGLKLPRVRRDSVCEPAFEHTLRYSDCDPNGHMRSSRYADMLCDAAESCPTPGFVSSFFVDFAAEYRLGDTVITEAHRDGNCVNVCGTDRNGKNHFTGQLFYTEEEA